MFDFINYTEEMLETDIENELVRNVTYKAVGTFEIIPEIGLRPRIDKISITH